MEKQIDKIEQPIDIIVKKKRGPKPKIKPPTDEIIIKKKRGKQPTPNGSVLDVEYFKQYYHSNLSHLVRCDICNRCVSFQKIKRHKLTKRCEKLKLIPFIQLQPVNIENN
jgi:hypothetical protein